jgi:hypothetical protein
MKLSDISKVVIDNRLPGTDEKAFNFAWDIFLEEINSYTDSEDLVSILDYDLKHNLFPYEGCRLIYKRLTELNALSPRILRWYAFILRFYGDPSDNVEADKLSDEADRMENLG